MPPSSRRELYRVVYPLNQRPILEIGRFSHAIIDCAERGLRFEVKSRRVPSLGTPLAGVVRFRRGVEVEVTGEVVRTRGATVAVALDLPGIPFSHILAEQRYLRARGFTLRD